MTCSFGPVGRLGHGLKMNPHDFGDACPPVDGVAPSPGEQVVINAEGEV